MAPVRTVPRAVPTAAPGAPTAVGHVRDGARAEALALRLQHPRRSWPVVVVSTPRGRNRPYVDPDRVLDDVRGLAEVVVIHTGEASWAFSRAMPGGTQVYGGACRVYPVGLEWVHHLGSSPLWFADDDAEGARARERLVQDALTAAAGAGLAGNATSTGTSTEARATVLGIVGTRALVRTEDGTTAQVAQELTLRTVPIDRLLAVDMSVQGRLDRGTQRLDVRGMLPDTAAQTELVRAAYPVGAVVPAQVHGVRADELVLALAPEVLVRIGRSSASGGTLDDLCDLFSVGEVVAARMLAPRPVPGPAGCGTRPDLRLDDVDDAAGVLPALGLLPGGPPWLPRPAVVDDPAASSDSPDPGPEHHGEDEPATGQHRILVPKPGPGPRPAVPPPGYLATAPEPESDPAPEPASVPETARVPHRALVNQLELSVHEHRTRADTAEARLTELRATVRGLEAEVAGLRDLSRDQHDQVERLQRDVERHKRSVRSAKKERRRTVEPAAPSRTLFADPVDQLRYDVLRTWAELVDAEEKDQYPLPDFAVGPGFCGTLADVGRGLEEKVHRAVVMVLTGRAQDVAGYELHRLRRGDGGGDPYRVRESDGAQAMRLSLQVSSPQARRLHYWVLPGGGVELSRVVLHDDVEP